MTREEGRKASIRSGVVTGVLLLLVVLLGLLARH